MLDINLEITPKVYIVLLNYNNFYDTKECLDSLHEINYDNFNIVIVDNKSTDDSLYKIKEYINNYYKPNITIIESDDNLGFSGGNNIGIKYALHKNADYICLLNNDTIVDKNFLKPLVDEMNNDKNIGICAGKIMYYDKKNIIWSAGGYVNNIKSLGIHYGINELDKGQFDYKREITFLTGCIQLIRREVFKNVGLYDEEYFLYMEDVDFCKRVKDYGYKLLYVPESKIYHKVSSSTGGQLSSTSIYYMYRNRILYNKKNNKNTIYYILFYLFFILKLFIEVFIKFRYYRYIVMGVIDGIKGNYGYRKL